MNRYEMPRSGHPQGIPLRDTAARRLARRHVNADVHQAPYRRHPVDAEMAAQILAELVDV
jgi:hypothetical protein